MLLKKGVRLLGVKPELLIGLMVADTIYNKNDEELTVTSIVDGKHSRTSKHYLGFGADLRTNDIDEDTVALITAQLKRQLPEFYILLEHKGTQNEHIHMHFNGTPN